MRKLISILLVSLLFTVSVYTAAATEEEVLDVGLFYQYTENLTATLIIDSAGNATCNGKITPKDSSYTCSIIVKLQRQSGGSWTSIATWSDSGRGYAGASAGGTKKVSSGYSYRVSVTTVVKNSSGSVIETPSKNSVTRTYNS